MSDEAPENELFEVDNLKVNEQAEITLLKAQILNISTELTSLKAYIQHLSALEIEATGSVTATAFIGRTIEVDEITTEELNINNMPIIHNANISNLDSNQIKADEAEFGNLSVNDTLTAKKLFAEELKLDSMKSDNFVLNGSINLGNHADMIIKVPYFENGMYCLKLAFKDSTFACIEIFNSMDNYCVRWSQKENGFIKNIYKSVEEQPAIYLQINNKKCVDIEARYGVMSTEKITESVKNAQLPQAAIDYNVIHQNGTKFFGNVE